MHQAKWAGLIALILVSMAVPAAAQQSTTGPVPPPHLDQGLRPATRAQVVIPGVPAYLWHHGCGPTALGMVVGYYDGNGFPNLVGGDASTMTSFVRAMIAEDHADSNCAAATPDHYRDYSCPLDAYPNLETDKSETGGAHTSNCVADFMYTSWSSLGNYYGWSWSSDVPGAFTGYVSYATPQHYATAYRQNYGQFSWEEYKQEIDGGYPVVLLVDTDGDGDTDHFVTGIGYDESTGEYGIYNTWDASIHWYLWREIAPGVTWGIYDVSTFRIYQLCGDANADGVLTIQDIIYLITYLFQGGPPPEPPGAADVDECGSLNMSDVVYLSENVICAGPEPCQGSAPCYLPTGNNQIRLGCPVHVPEPDGDSVPLPIYLTNEVTIEGFSLGFFYNSDDIEITSVDLTGSKMPAPWWSFTFSTFFPVANFVSVGAVDLLCSDPLPPQTDGLLLTLWIQVPPGTPDQWVDIDSAFVPPGGEFILCVDGGGSVVPQYSDCHLYDILIGPYYVCGDADGNGIVNISDAVFLITYIFGGGPPPDPLLAGDADCNGIVNISDGVYLIAYIFAGGPEPCSQCP